ncbi:MAG: hypothetical protein WD355_03205 [Balneolaceae bacterium]
MIDIVRSITRQMSQQIPDGKEYLIPRELREWEIPGFLAEQVEIFIQRTLRESLVFPETEWVNRNKPSIQRSWDVFSDSLMAEARLPVTQAPRLFEEVITSLLKILLTPRGTIPDIIFGSQRELTARELEERAGRVPVYRHLAQAPVRFLEKKGLETLTLEQCRRVITRVDEKLASRYHANDWYQLINPLFQLAGGPVDSDLLRIFFNDKNMGSVARSFELLNRPVSKSEFSGMLESFDFPLDAEPATELHSAGGEEPATLFERFGSTGEDEQEETADEPVGQQAMYLHSGKLNRNVEEKDTQDFAQEEESGDVQPEETVPAPDAEPPSLYSQFMEGSDTEEATDDVLEESNPEDHAIWKRFVESDREQVSPAGDSSGEPVADHREHNTESEVETNRHDSVQHDRFSENRDQIEAWIGDERGRFVETLFRGSEMEFQKVVDGLAGINNWREAAEYIEEEVFDRYELELSNESAIDFTDTMHSYFMDSKPAN